MGHDSKPVRFTSCCKYWVPSINENSYRLLCISPLTPCILNWLNSLKWIFGLQSISANLSLWSVQFQTMYAWLKGKIRIFSSDYHITSPAGLWKGERFPVSVSLLGWVQWHRKCPTTHVTPSVQKSAKYVLITILQGKKNCISSSVVADRPLGLHICWTLEGWCTQHNSQCTVTRFWPWELQHFLKQKRLGCVCMASWKKLLNLRKLGCRSLWRAPLQRGFTAKSAAHFKDSWDGVGLSKLLNCFVFLFINNS